MTNHIHSTVNNVFYTYIFSFLIENNMLKFKYQIEFIFIFSKVKLY